MVFSDGEKVPNPHCLQAWEKLAKEQKKLAKKKNGSNNCNKARLKVARIHAKIADTRQDFMQKLTSKIVDENQVIVLESLQVKNMLRNHKLAKAISDVNWGEFKRQLLYNAQWYGRVFVSIDTFFPSSKTCWDCGQVLTRLPLAIHAWTCPACGTEHDRDINAARNILAEGQAVIACGDGVRPSGSLSVTTSRQSSMKQETLSASSEIPRL